MHFVVPAHTTCMIQEKHWSRENLVRDPLQALANPSTGEG